MKNNFNLNESVVTILKSSISQDASLIAELMNLLSLGKEAVYRRLRGEVSFTFEEVVKLSLNFGFSLDSVVGIKNNERAVFSLDVLGVENLEHDYVRRISKYVAIFRKMQAQANFKAYCASNMIPYSLYFPFENLSRFFLYRWYYQVNKTQLSMRFSELSMSDNLLNAQKEFTEESENLKKMVFILDREIFNFTLNDISYFFKLNLITRDELEVLKREMLELIDRLESLTISGTFKNGMRVIFYLANVSLEGSYSHFESDNMFLSHLRVFSINNLDSESPKISRTQREWIESLKRCSSLITQSGEVERFAFFGKQREAISALGTV